MNRKLLSIFSLFAASLAYIMSVSHRLIQDGDPFWAIKTGQWVLTHGIPHTDPFSWTARGLPWVAHEWLFDTAMYWLAAHFGWYGIMFIVWAALFGFLACLWLLCKAEGKGETVTLVVFTIAAVMPTWYVMDRPQVYSYFFFALFTYILTWRTGTRWPWILPAVTLLWANMHGSAVMGVLMVGFEAILESVIEKKHTLWSAAIASFLASLVNPNGFGLWKFTFWLTTSPLNRQISEWRPPDFAAPPILILYAAVFATVACAMYAHKQPGREPQDRRRMVSAFLYVAGLGLVSVSEARYFPYLAISWVVLFLRLIPDGIMVKRSAVKYKAVLVALVIFLIGRGFAQLPPQSIAAGIEQGQWPIKAVNYIKAHPALEDHIFNFYTWGGYLIWRDVPSFIDGRADIFESNCSVFKDYLDATNLKSPEAVLKRYGIKTILMPRDSLLAVYLKGRPGWKVVYQDNVAVLYERRLK